MSIASFGETTVGGRRFDHVDAPVVKTLAYRGKTIEVALIRTEGNYVAIVQLKDGSTRRVQTRDLK